VTSAFITQVGSQLQPDPNEETAALLRVLIYKFDNTTFGNNVPTLPQWAGPQRTIVQVEAILYASLATSLFSAFLAMLGKQWLNRYASTDMRGSTIERSQNRQRKLDGIVNWYFDRVMESLPLMLQFALLLLGCALSLYLWGIDTAVASVAIGFTSCGVGLYALIVIAGMVSVSCPYQTPGARTLRHTLRLLRRTPSRVLGMLRPVSISIRMLAWFWVGFKKPSLSMEYIVFFFAAPLIALLMLPVCLALDACHLAGVVVSRFFFLPRRACDWFRSIGSARAHGSDPQVITLDLRYISWILRTSLDKAVYLSTLKSLAAMTTLTNFNPALVSACVDILASCVAVVGRKMVITQGSEELAAASVMCCLNTLSHLAATDPTLSTLKDLCKWYTGTFPLGTEFEGLPSDRIFSAIHNILYSSQPKIQWKDYKLPDNDQTVLARTLAELAHSHLPGARWGTRGIFLQAMGPNKVPRWILRFALHYLSQNPLPHSSIVAHCLLIIAIDLGCTVPNIATLDERYVYV